MEMMPEAPEVEKLRLQLAPAWTGQIIKKFTTLSSQRSAANRFVPDGDWETFHKKVAGSKVVGINRLGKNLFVQLDAPQLSRFAEFRTLIWHIHLSSTGWLLPANDIAKVVTKVDPIHANFLHKVSASNIRLKIVFEEGQVWGYHDSRTWGRFQILEGGAWDPRTYEPYGQYGPDVLLEQEAAYGVLRALDSTKRTVKDVLTDQYIVAGLGNYLACEICHRAGMHPLRPWNVLKELDRAMIGIQMRAVLQDSFSHSDHSHWRVFKRLGMKCSSCGMADIEYVKDSISSKRGSYFCPVCQGET